MVRTPVRELRILRDQRPVQEVFRHCEALHGLRLLEEEPESAYRSGVRTLGRNDDRGSDGTDEGDREANPQGDACKGIRLDTGSLCDCLFRRDRTSERAFLQPSDACAKRQNR